MSIEDDACGCNGTPHHLRDPGCMAKPDPTGAMQVFADNSGPFPGPTPRGEGLRALGSQTAGKLLADVLGRPHLARQIWGACGNAVTAELAHVIESRIAHLVKQQRDADLADIDALTSETLFRMAETADRKREEMRRLIPADTPDTTALTVERFSGVSRG